MNEYIAQLSDKDILDLGKMLTGKSSTRLKKYEFINGTLNSEFRVDKNAPKGTTILEHTKVYSVNAVFNDYGIDGTINSFYPLNSERYFEKFVEYMINRFGKEYAVNLYNHHKKILDEIDAVATLMESRTNYVNDNPMVLNLIKIKSANLRADYNKKLKDLQVLINNNLYGKDKIETFNIK